MIKSILQLLLVFQLAFVSKTFSQNIAINTTGNMPDTSAMLDITSTNKGLLVPRMTTAEMNAIPSPANGLLIYNTSLNTFEVNTGTSLSPNWVPLTTSNIYTANGTLTGNRTVTLGGNPLNFYDAATTGTTTFTGAAQSIMNTSPAGRAELDLYAGPSAMYMFIDGGNAAQLTTTATSLEFATINAAPLRFYTNNAQRMVIDPSGNVGIGNITTPAHQLQVVGQAQIDTLTSGSITDSIVTVNANGAPGGVLRKVSVASVIKNMWTINGNTATTSGTNTIGNAADGNYAGTSDTSKFVIGVNATKRMIFDRYGNAYGGDGGTSVQTTANVINSNNSRNFVWGNNNQITTNSANGGARSNAMFGGGNKIIGDYFGSNLGAQNFVTGSANTIIGSGNFVAGLNNSDTASYSFIAGGNNTLGISASYGVAIGQYLTISTANQTAFGKYNKDTITAIFAIGTGTGTGSASSNAITVSNGGSVPANNGNIGINNINNPLKRLHINAANSSGAADSLKIDNLALNAGSNKKQYLVIDSATGYVSRSNILPGMVQTITVTNAAGAPAYTIKTTDYIVEFTGTAAATWTLPSSPVTGQIFHLVNMGTVDVTLSATVTLANGITSAVVGTGTGNIQNTGATATVNILGNKSCIVYDGTKWIQINN